MLLRKTLLLFLIFSSPIFSSHAVEVKKIGDDYTATIQKEGTSFYFNLVKMTEANLSFWKSYADKANLLSLQFYRMYKDSGINPEALERHTRYFASEAEKQDFLERLQGYRLHYQEKAQHANRDEIEDIEGKLNWQLFSNGVTNGIAGMQNVICSSDDALKHVYIAFVSIIPLEEIDQTVIFDKYCFNYPSYVEHFSPIVVSVMVLHHPKAPLSTHFGIFRNPLSFHRHFMGEELHTKGLSMALHGFAAYVEQGYFEGAKKYMATWPVASMNTIFKRKVDHGYLHIGTNKSFQRCSLNKENHALPLIFELDSQKKGVIAIAKEGLDIRKREELKGEEIFYHAEETVEFSAFTPCAKRVLVNLEGLIPYFLNLAG